MPLGTHPWTAFEHTFIIAVRGPSGNPNRAVKLLMFD